MPKLPSSSGNVFAAGYSWSPGNTEQWFFSLPHTTGMALRTLHRLSMRHLFKRCHLVSVPCPKPPSLTTLTRIMLPLAATPNDSKQRPRVPQDDGCSTG